MADDFKISNLDMRAVNPALGVTEGLACHDGHLYVTPHNDYIIAKIDTRTFKIVDTLDLKKVDPALIGLLGCFVAGDDLYILPHLTDSGPIYGGDVVRVDLRNFTPRGCSVLKVFDGSQALNAASGMTDGHHGYLSMHANGQAIVTRFGLGSHFKPDSISTVAIPSIDGFPVAISNLAALDKKAAYLLATVVTDRGTGSSDRKTDLWLVTVPTGEFKAKAVKTQRLTALDFVRNTLPVCVDDGENLWFPPLPIAGGPLAGKSVPLMKIPKAQPAGLKRYESLATAASPASTGRTWNSGTPIYDGWRYGYLASDNAKHIVQIDTQKGSVHAIDISAFCGGYPMWGLGYDGKWAYAASYNGGAGLCLRFLPTPKPAGCPCGHDDDQGGHGGDDDHGPGEHRD